MLPEYMTIPCHPPVTDEMKQYNIEGNPYTGQLGEISEWAARMALREFPVGSEQLLSEVVDRATQHQFDLVLSDMVDHGILNMSWCDEDEEFKFGLTQGGREMFGDA
mgnify:CR=1 FL=1